MVAKFMFGLCNSKTFAHLKQQFFEIGSVQTAKLKLLRQLAFQTFPDSTLDDGHFFEEVLRLVSWCYELNDENLATKIANHLPSHHHHHHHHFAPGMLFLLFLEPSRGSPHAGVSWFLQPSRHLSRS